MAKIAAEYVKIDELNEWENNPRKNDSAVDEVAESIKRFGFSAPIIARKEDKMIIAGHTRFKAAKKLGLVEIPVRFMDLDMVDAQLLAIADNKLNERAEWDTELLEQVLNELADEDLSNLGFDDNELNNFLENLESEEESDRDPIELEPVEINLDFQLLKGNCLEKLQELEDCSIDSIVTDPPYELGFMGKAWDSTGIAYSVELWAECLRVLKPGGHLVAFSGSRTVFPMGVALQDAGFEVRDMISWIYTSGFPKSLDISKAIDNKLGVSDQRKVIEKRTSGIGSTHCGQEGAYGFKDNFNITAPASPEATKWQGWGTALKPAQEPAVLARKPIDPDCSSIAENVLKWGTGAINIDAGRFPYGDGCHFGDSEKPQSTQNPDFNNNRFLGSKERNGTICEPSELGRWPANVYQCSKPQRAEKEAGLEHLANHVSAAVELHGKDSKGLNSPRAGAGRTAEQVKNFHPTVKPIKLMRWLCRLLTPAGGTVLDPFLGSGTTAVSAILEGFNAVGCEMTADYYPIIEGRINWAKKEYRDQDQEAE